jgi:hypothetical protein
MHIISFSFHGTHAEFLLAIEGFRVTQLNLLAESTKQQPTISNQFALDVADKASLDSNQKYIKYESRWRLHLQAHVVECKR